MLVDNELRKAVPGEESSMIVLPTWEHCKGEEGSMTWDHLGAKVDRF